MLAENSNYCLKNETEYQEQDPEELSETQTGLSNLQAQYREGVQGLESCKQPGQFSEKSKNRKETFSKNNLP